MALVAPWALPIPHELVKPLHQPVTAEAAFTRDVTRLSSSKPIHRVDCQSVTTKRLRKKQEKLKTLGYERYERLFESYPLEEEKTKTTKEVPHVPKADASRPFGSVFMPNGR